MIVLDELEIISVERRIPLGVTYPYLIKCSDNNSYVAKFPGNPDGTRVLINEYVCAELAKLLGLPIPRYKLVKENNINKFENNLTDIKMINGTIFCSEWLDKSTKLPGYYILTKINNKIDAIKILIFDVLIGNNDRNEGNLLINFKNNSLVMIDHSHVFIKESLWDEITLKDLIGAPIDLSKMNKVTFENLKLCLNDRNYIEFIPDYIENIKSIDSDKIDKILNGIPSDWTISISEKQSLKEFILDRIKRIDEICELLEIEGGD